MPASVKPSMRDTGFPGQEGGLFHVHRAGDANTALEDERADGMWMQGQFPRDGATHFTRADAIALVSAIIDELNLSYSELGLVDAPDELELIEQELRS